MVIENKQLEQEEPKEPSFFSKAGAWLRGNFIAGLLFILPVFITFYIIKLVVGLLDSTTSSLFPEQYQPSNLLPYDVFGVEIVLGAILVVIIGLIVRNLVGSKLLSWWETMLNSIPGVRSVYGAVKQIIDTLAQSNSTSFREVVLIEYPRKGLWAIAFVTGKTKGEVQKLKDDELINIFLPTTPNPTSGFLLFVPRKDLITLSMTVDQGLKMVISAGIVTPTMAQGKAALKQLKEYNDDGEALNGKGEPFRRRKIDNTSI